MKTSKLVVSGKHQCDNCSKTFDAKKLLDIQDLFERVEGGSIVPSGECPSCGALCYPVASESNICLIRNTGIELEVVAGPYTGSKTQRSAWLQRNLLQLCKDDAQDDTYHVLDLNDLSICAFSGGYMENIRWAAGGCLGDHPDTWDNKKFALLNQKAIIKKTNRSSK